MDKVKIESKQENSVGWDFVVSLSQESEYHVSIERDYWQKLTIGKMPPEELLQKSFQFLLEREPKESILKKFDLSVIQRYFPEYESTIIDL